MFEPWYKNAPGFKIPVTADALLFVLGGAPAKARVTIC